MSAFAILLNTISEHYVQVQATQYVFYQASYLNRLGEVLRHNDLKAVTMLKQSGHYWNM
jgi:hypothetical protein